MSDFSHWRGAWDSTCSTGRPVPGVQDTLQQVRTQTLTPGLNNGWQAHHRPALSVGVSGLIKCSTIQKLGMAIKAWFATIRWLRGLLCVSECSFMLLGCGNSSSHIQRISSDYFVWKLCFVHGEQSTTWWFTQTDNWKDRNRQRYLWATVKEYEKSPVFGERNWSLASKVPL